MNLEEGVALDGNQPHAEKSKTSLEIETVVSPEKIRELLGDDPEAVILKILEDMADIVPLEFSQMAISDIIESLLEQSSAMNKVWASAPGENQEILGFLVCAEYSEEELYVKYLAAKKIDHTKAPAEIIEGNIAKLIQKAKKAGYKRLSFHGFNRVLNYLLKKRYGFQKDEEQDIFLGEKAVPYLFLDLETIKQEKPLSDTDVFMDEIGEIIRVRKTEESKFDEEEWTSIKKKVFAYLKKTQKDIRKITPEEKERIISIIIENWEQLLFSPAGVNGVLEKDKKEKKTQEKSLREQRAFDENLEPEIIIQKGDYSLVRLITLPQMEEESDTLSNCVGESTHYINAYIHGEREIWSFREDGEAQATIEYDPNTQTVLQLKLYDDDTLEGDESIFEPLLEILRKLKFLKPPIIVKRFNDMEKLKFSDEEEEFHRVKTEDKSVFTLDGVVPLNDYLEKPEKSPILSGNVWLRKDTSPDFIEKVARIPGLILYFARDFPQTLKNSLSSIEGSIVDYSRNVHFESLQFCGGNISFGSDVRTVDFSSLEEVNGEIDAGTVSAFNAPKLRVCHSDFVLKNIKPINFPSLESVSGNFVISRANSISLPSLKKVEGEFETNFTGRVFLPELKQTGNLNLFQATSIILPKITTIHGSFKGHDAEEVVMSSLTTVETDLNFDNVENIRLDKLRHLGGDFSGDKLKSAFLPELKKVEGNFSAFSATQISLPKLEEVEGDFSLQSTLSLVLPEMRNFLGNVKVPSATEVIAPKLESVKGSFESNSAEEIDFPLLQKVDSYLSLKSAVRVSLPSLTLIGGSFYAHAAQKVFLPKLEVISGEIYLPNCQEINVKNLVCSPVFGRVYALEDIKFEIHKKSIRMNLPETPGSELEMHLFINSASPEDKELINQYMEQRKVVEQSPQDKAAKTALRNLLKKVNQAKEAWRQRILS